MFIHYATVGYLSLYVIYKKKKNLHTSLLHTPIFFSVSFQVENRALRLREAMQQYQDEVIPSSPTALKQHQQQQLEPQQQQQQHIFAASQNSNRLHTSIVEGSVDPRGIKPRVGGLNVLLPQEEISHHIISTSGLAASPNAFGGGGTGNGLGEWEYFDEAGYIRGGALRTGEDPYIRNRFNQEASDALPSNREIPDTRHPMYAGL